MIECRTGSNLLFYSSLVAQIIYPSSGQSIIDVNHNANGTFSQSCCHLIRYLLEFNFELSVQLKNILIDDTELISVTSEQPG